MLESGYCDLARLTFPDSESAEGVSVNPRLTIDPEISEWGNSPFYAERKFDERLRFYKAALDLIRNSRITPETIVKEDDQHVLLHRFYGITKDGTYFCVQIKEDKRSDRRDFMSTFERHPR